MLFCFCCPAIWQRFWRYCILHLQDFRFRLHRCICFYQFADGFASGNCDWHGAGRCSTFRGKPRDPSAGILTGSFLGKIVAEGALIACPVMTSYYIGLQQSIALAATMAFATLTLARLFHGFNCRSQKSMARVGLGSNKYSMGAFLGGCILLGLVLCVPVFERLFDVAEMGVLMYGYILLLAFVPTLVIQMVKMVREKMQEGL